MQSDPRSLQESIEGDLKAYAFATVETPNVPYFEQEHLFGEKVPDVLPDAAEDIGNDETIG